METLDLLRSGQLAGTKRLNLACGLTEFPVEIFDLADSLEILDLSNNHLKSLPSGFGQLKKLKIVFFTNNAFEEIPEILAQCPSLDMVSFKSNNVTIFADNALPPAVRWLILTNNRIEQLPASIGKLKNLQKLMLAGNKLQSLPDEMASCLNLELIRLAANRFESLPAWLFALPRLSWLAYAGNPCCYTDSSLQSPLPDISWTDLKLGDTLGQGASGIIFKGIWNPKHSQELEVAVKVFKGEITSDGLPADEMRACIAAGAHDSLVKVLGKLVNHPEDKAGLVLSFIPPNYKNLGEPPDFDTCTRDRYSSGTFSLAVILRITKGIASAAAHLHSKGIMHGDLYAHNILVNELGDSLLGDFGAASFYDPTDPFVGQMTECIEVRAFGCLLEEMLDHCELESSQAAIATLRGLQQDCMSQIPSTRPSFIKICEVLARAEQQQLGFKF